MDFFLEAACVFLKIMDQLGRHGVPGIRRLFPEPWQLLPLQFLYFLLSGRDIQIQVPEIFQVFLIHHVKHSDIFKHLHPGLLQLCLNPVYLDLQDFIAADKLLRFVFGAFQKWNFGQKPFIISRVCDIHLFQLRQKLP